MYIDVYLTPIKQDGRTSPSLYPKEIAKCDICSIWLLGMFLNNFQLQVTYSIYIILEKHKETDRKCHSVV